MNPARYLITALLFAAMMNYGPTSALAVPQQINYQGSLTGPSGTPLDTTVAITFNIWPVPAGGTPDWTETHLSVTVSDGLFHVLLGSVTTLPDLFSVNRWLGITIGGDTEMTPRQQIVSVAHAYRVGTVDGASGGTVSSDLEALGNLKGDTLIADVGVRFPDGTLQATAGISSGQQYPDTNAWDATRTWVKSMGYLRGTNNAISATGFVGGGDNNKARGDYSVIGGGGGVSAFDSNSARALVCTISGGRGNNVSGAAATVGGGYGNDASGSYATVGGGYNNNATGFASTVSGYNNTATDDYATIGGGRNNRARGDYSFVGGGGGTTPVDSNTASGDFSFIGGGSNNTASGDSSVVCGGSDNTASVTAATVGGGYSNVASDFAATIPGGYDCNASGRYSFAAGRRANANDDGAFVWADSTDALFTSPGINTFNVRSSGGIEMWTNAAATVGVTLLAGDNTWNSICDSTLKTKIERVDGAETLNKIAELPVYRWHHKGGDPNLQHIGPMAQDFWNAFHVGGDSLKISTIDPSGIALAAIQELAKVQEQHRVTLAELSQKEVTIKSLETRLFNLETAFSALSEKLTANPLTAGQESLTLKANAKGE